MSNVPRSYASIKIAEATSFFILSYLQVAVRSADECPAAETLEAALPRGVSLTRGCQIMGGPEIQNVVSTANVGCKLDLPYIASHGKNVEYNPKRFGGAIMRAKNPRAVALVFGSGKLVIPGAKSVEDGQRRARKFCRDHQETRVPDEIYGLQGPQHGRVLQHWIPHPAWAHV